MKKVFLVIGPESSGTRMMTSVMLKLGCRGCKDHGQPVDGPLSRGVGPLAKFLEDKGDLFVVRRSFPHGGGAPDAANILKRFFDVGWTNPYVVITQRNNASMFMSQRAVGHVPDKATFFRNVEKAYKNIFNAVYSTDYKYFVMNFGDLLQYPIASVDALCDYFGLEFNREAVKHIRQDVEINRIQQYLKERGLQ